MKRILLATTCLWLAAPAFAQGVAPKIRLPGDIRNFGAVCDGVVGNATGFDNAAAINAAIAWAAQNHDKAILPGAVCNFKSELSYLSQARNYGIVGAGPEVSVLQYTGASTTTDLMGFGQTGISYNSVGLGFSGFWLTSTTTMTAGTGLHLMETSASTVANARIDGTYGNGNLYHGVWFDGVGNGDWLRAYDIRAQCDGVRVNYGADLSMDGGGRVQYSGNYSGSVASCPVGTTAGVHIGGAFGGFEGVSGDIIGNGTNFLVDNAITATLNREIFIHPAFIVDTAVRDNIVLNDTLISTGTFVFRGYSSGAGRYGLNVISWPNSTIMLSARVLLNQGDGVHIADSSTLLTMAGDTQLLGNGTGASGGYGINCTSPMSVYGAFVAQQSNTGGAATGINVADNCVLTTGKGYPASVSFRTTSPQLTATGSVPGATLTSTLVNQSSANSTSAVQQVATNVAFHFINMQAAIDSSGVPSATLNAGAGATGGLTVANGAGPLKLLPTAGNLILWPNTGYFITALNLPTSCSGAPSKALWNNANVINICP